MISILSYLLLLGCQECEFVDMEERVAASCGNAENLSWLQDMISHYQNHVCPLLLVEQGVYQKKIVFIMQHVEPALAVAQQCWVVRGNRFCL